jgi:UDP-N-acetyl-D-mannosaminuronic acid dehydrogenase
MLLAASCDRPFGFGLEAVKVNEGMPAFLVERLERRHDLRSLTVGLLGMAFKSNSDDTRASLGYELAKLLESRCKAVLTTDPHVVTDPALRPLEEVVSGSDLLILCVPHAAYRALDARGKTVIDMWNFFGRGSLI